MRFEETPIGAKDIGGTAAFGSPRVRIEAVAQGNDMWATLKSK